MKFVDTLKALMAKNAPAQLEPTGAPIFLMVGSISGCTKKDALQYVRGLAEQNVIAPAGGRVQVFHDKPRNRWVYEVHEGGIEFSIAEKVVEALQVAGPVRIALVNGAHLSIEEHHGEIFSLVHPKGEGVYAAAAPVADPAQLELLDADVSAYAGTTQLLELFPENNELSKIGGYLLAVSFVLFITLGLLYTFVQAGVFDKDALLTLSKAGHVADTTDNPAWQLEKARTEADKAGMHINALKKGPTGWSWELSQ